MMKSFRLVLGRGDQETGESSGLPAVQIDGRGVLELHLGLVIEDEDDVLTLQRGVLAQDEVGVVK
jgi:hypothetical protein